MALHNVPEIDQLSYSRHVKHTLSTGGNLIVFGEAGSGKTEIAQALGKDTGMAVQYMNGSCLEPPDLIGLPVPDKIGRTVEYLSPKFLPLVENGAPETIMLFDEIDKIKPELQNVLLEILQFRSINGRPLNIKSIIATGNLPDEHAHSEPVSHALTNRCSVVRLRVMFDPWRDWAVTHGVHPLITGFLSRNPEMLNKKSDTDDATEYNKPTPRSWVAASRDLMASKDEDYLWQYTLVASRVGSSAATQFRVWLEHYREIEPMVDALVLKGIEPEKLSKGGDAGETVQRGYVLAIAAFSQIAAVMNKTPIKTEKSLKEVNKLCKNVVPWVMKQPIEFRSCAVKSVFNHSHVREYFTEIPIIQDMFNTVSLSFER